MAALANYSSLDRKVYFDVQLASRPISHLSNQTSGRPNSVSAECSAEYLVSVSVSVKATETEFRLTIFFK